MSFLSKIIGDPNKKVLDQIQPIVEKVNSFEPEIKKLSDEQLKNKTEEFKKRLADETLDNLLPEAFAVVREAAKRTLGQRHFDVQLLGGIILHQGKISEMKTGEGKTLVATLPIYLNALKAKGVHLVTVNDYLAKRDVNWMGAVYHFLGLSVGCVQHEKAFIFDPKVKSDNNEATIEQENLREVSRKEAYKCDILYGTNNEFGFDYLRDNMAQSLENMVQRPLNFAIVDEVDSILIDEARTPLIISAPDMESANLYKTFAGIIPHLEENNDYNIDEKMKAATLTEEGINKVEKLLGLKDIYQEKSIAYVHHLEQALRAQVLFQRDRDYVIKDGEVIIVDSFTGRLMPGRRFSEGLHQALEAKENVEVQRESRTLATITFQNYFRLYKKLAGMTGTAATNAEEFAKVYKLEVVVIPTNKPMIRRDFSDRIYKTEQGKFKAVVKEIKERREKGQPVLVGTIAIEKSEFLSAILKREGISHEVLNAKHHEQEAKIISKAGQENAITIATNMAGRGTDIKLGKTVAEKGGLHIIGTERHEARRIDNQLRGRTGRQGDPGSTQFFISMEDEVMRVFGSDKMKALMDRLRIPEDQPIENKFISKSIEGAQGKIEGYNFDARKHILEYDDVMNKHREVIYKKRREILKISSDENKQANLKKKVLEMIKNEIAKTVDFHANSNGQRSGWNVQEISEVMRTIFPPPEDVLQKLNEIKNSSVSDEQARGKIIEYLQKMALKIYEIKEEAMESEAMRAIEKAICLRTIDMLWMEHLEMMEHVRQGVGLRGYGQRDPLVEYKKEAYQMFNRLLDAIQTKIVTTIYKVDIVRREPAPLENQQMKFSGGDETAGSMRPQLANFQTDGRRSVAASPLKTSFSNFSQPISKKPKVGRNDPCPCGSGKKYKKCCGK
jgi:preprotein translocase subunit SecA